MPGAAPDERLFAIGRVGAPKGVRGDLKIHSYSGEYEHFLELEEVLLEGEVPAPPPAVGAAGAGDSPQAEGGKSRRRLRLKVLRAQASAGGLSMAFAGYESPEAARKLTGMDILVPREGAAPLGENEWYIADLVGLDLVADGKKLAKVISVLEGGPEPWLEARLPGGGKAIVPFRKEFVGEVRLETGEIVLLAPWILE